MDPKQRYLLNQFKEVLSKYSPQQLISDSFNLQVPDSIRSSIVTAWLSRYELGLDYKDIIGLAFLLRYYCITDRKVGKYYASSIIDYHWMKLHSKYNNLDKDDMIESLRTIDPDEIRKYTNYLIKKLCKLKLLNLN